jgi:hypothetical protein
MLLRLARVPKRLFNRSCVALLFLGNKRRTNFILETCSLGRDRKLFCSHKDTKTTKGFRQRRSCKQESALRRGRREKKVAERLALLRGLCFLCALCAKQIACGAGALFVSSCEQTGKPRLLRVQSGVRRTLQVNRLRLLAGKRCSTIHCPSLIRAPRTPDSCHSPLQPRRKRTVTGTGLALLASAQSVAQRLPSSSGSLPAARAAGEDLCAGRERQFDLLPLGEVPQSGFGDELVARTRGLVERQPAIGQRRAQPAPFAVFAGEQDARRLRSFCGAEISRVARSWAWSGLAPARVARMASGARPSQPLSPCGRGEAAPAAAGAADPSPNPLPQGERALTRRPIMPFRLSTASRTRP